MGSDSLIGKVTIQAKGTFTPPEVTDGTCRDADTEPQTDGIAEDINITNDADRKPCTD